MFTKGEIWSLYDQNYKIAIRKLQALPICYDRKRELKLLGLAGWIFEQTVQYCIRKELRAAKVNHSIIEQFSLGGRAKADLQIGKVAIEIKRSGIYSKEGYVKYCKYRKMIEKDGGCYLFFSGEESYLPNRTLSKKVFGGKNIFFLDSTRDWKKFVHRIIECAHERT